MLFPYSSNGRPLLPLVLTLGTRSVSVQGLVDSGADVNVIPWSIGEAIGAAWDSRKTTLRLGGTLIGTPAMPLVASARFGDIAPVRLAFAWCQTDDVPLVLGQTNFFMEFDVCFLRSQMQFSVVASG